MSGSEKHGPVNSVHFFMLFWLMIFYKWFVFAQLGQPHVGVGQQN